MKNPFRRRKCCEVLLLEGQEDVGADVSGVLRVDDTWVHFVGVVVDPEVEDERVESLLDTARFVIATNQDLHRRGE